MAPGRRSSATHSHVVRCKFLRSPRVQALLGAAAAAAVTGALSLNLVAQAVNSEQLLFLEVGCSWWGLRGAAGAQQQGASPTGLHSTALPDVPSRVCPPPGRQHACAHATCATSMAGVACSRQGVRRQGLQRPNLVQGAW